MIFDFYPWKIDANIEKTKKFYQGNDYSSNKEWNKMFVDILNPMQREFFDNLGIDLMKIEVRKNEFEDNEEVPFIYTINFLLCGKFLSMTKYQLDMYADEEIFGTDDGEEDDFEDFDDDEIEYIDEGNVEDVDDEGIEYIDESEIEDLDDFEYEEPSEPK